MLNPSLSMCVFVHFCWENPPVKNWFEWFISFLTIGHFSHSTSIILIVSCFLHAKRGNFSFGKKAGDKTNDRMPGFLLFWAVAPMPAKQMADYLFANEWESCFYKYWRAFPQYMWWALCANRGICIWIRNSGRVLYFIRGFLVSFTFRTLLNSQNL